MVAIGAYAAFLILATVLTTALGSLLRRHGDMPARCGDEAAIGRSDRSLSRLAVLGFYLIAAGAVVLLLRYGGAPRSIADGIGFLATRGGALLLVLGIAQFQCLAMLTRAAAPRGRQADPARPRRAREDPLDRVFAAVPIDSRSGA